MRPDMTGDMVWRMSVVAEGAYTKGQEGAMLARHYPESTT
jgi:hypothetical protein